MSNVLITGTSSGFGELSASSFARAGHRVVASMRNLDKGDRLRKLAADDGLDLQLVGLDVNDEASVLTAVSEAETMIGSLDIVVNNAGIELRGPVELCSDDEVKLQFDTNVFGPLRVIRAVVPGMRQRGGGVIVNVGSIAGLVSRPFGGLYAASKHAIEAITDALHYELKAFGIRVAVVEPGQYATALLDNASDAAAFGPESPYRASAEEFDTKIRTLNPDGQLADPQEVADAIVRVATDGGAPVHTLLGSDAHLIVEARAGGDFETFEQTMRTTLDWWT